MSDPTQQVLGRLEKVDSILFDAIHKDLVRLEVARIEGKAVFHLHRKTEVHCKNCQHRAEDPLINKCPKCGVDANKVPGVLVNKPLYTGIWGRSLEKRLQRVLEEIFREGVLEWVPELDSWHFTPKTEPIDHHKAATAILDRLVLA